jgi:hypothetical protein
VQTINNLIKVVSSKASFSESVRSLSPSDFATRCPGGSRLQNPGHVRAPRLDPQGAGFFLAARPASRWRELVAADGRARLCRVTGAENNLGDFLGVDFDHGSPADVNARVFRLVIAHHAVSVSTILMSGLTARK